jgi:hypothetical protein
MDAFRVGFRVVKTGTPRTRCRPPYKLTRVSLFTHCGLKILLVNLSEGRTIYKTMHRRVGAVIRNGCTLENGLRLYVTTAIWSEVLKLAVSCPKAKIGVH